VCRSWPTQTSSDRIAKIVLMNEGRGKVKGDNMNRDQKRTLILATATFRTWPARRLLRRLRPRAVPTLRTPRPGQRHYLYPTRGHTSADLDADSRAPDRTSPDLTTTPDANPDLTVSGLSPSDLSPPDLLAFPTSSPQSPRRLIFLQQNLSPADVAPSRFSPSPIRLPTVALI